MKTIDEIKKEVAKKHQIESWESLTWSLKYQANPNKYINECMQEYAKQVAEAQREACAKPYKEPLMLKEGFYVRILNTPLITDNI